MKPYLYLDVCLVWKMAWHLSFINSFVKQQLCESIIKNIKGCKCELSVEKKKKAGMNIMRLKGIMIP